MRRVAALGDGWLASAYNTTPERFAQGLSTLRAQLADAGRDPSTFANALATMWVHVGGDSEGVLSLMAAGLGRPADDLREQLLIGPPSKVAETVARYRDAGLQRMFVWPIGPDPVEQLELFADAVL
jgi:alkanesulfonate monooxygenase SsuD/methylene tetrahydromethanopterin reductase-like flavin-dependent oxidoreductase (luciferase family)